MQRLWELFDYQDGNLYRKEQVNKCLKGSLVGCKKPDGYIYVGIDKKQYAIHRIIYCMFYGYCPRVVDHINSNKVNNKIENLRAASHSQNSWNAKMPKTNTSGIKGVSWHKKSCRWRAQITFCGKKISRSFDSIQQAAQAVNTARLQLHGEFARHI